MIYRGRSAADEPVAELLVGEVGCEFKQREIRLTTAIRRWVQAHRYRVIVRELRSLSLTELRALEIEPSEINYLAFEASRGEQPETTSTLRLTTKKASYAEKPLMVIMPLAALGLIALLTL